MRIHALFGVLAFGLLGLTSAEAFPPDNGYGDGTCAPTATTTVFVTVPATNAASPPFVAGPQTVTVTIPASYNGAPGNPLSPVYTVTVQTFGPGESSPYNGPRPWESRLTATGVATRTITLPAPDAVPSTPTGGNGSPGTNSPGPDDNTGTPGTPGPGSPGTDGGNGSPAPDGASDNPGSSGGSPADGSQSDPDCVTVITTTLYRTETGTGNGSPTVDTVVATLTFTYPHDADGSNNDGSGTVATNAPDDGQLQPSIITRTVYQPAIGPGQPSPSPSLVVETITIQAQDPNAAGSNGPGVTAVPGIPGDSNSGPFSVITTTLYHARTIPGQAVVTTDTIVASFTIAFPPVSPTNSGNDGSSGSPAGTDGSVTFITTTWYETTTCLDSLGNPTPTVVTHATTIASVLPLRASNVPDAGVGSQASGDHGDLVTVITETVYRPVPTLGHNGEDSPLVDTIVATITATFPGDAMDDGSTGADIVTVIVTTLYVTATSPAGSSGGELTSSNGAVVQTLTVTIPSPPPVPGGSLTGAPVATPGSGNGFGPDSVITTSLYRTATYIGPDGQATVTTETYVATITAGTSPFGPYLPTGVPNGAPGPIPDNYGGAGSPNAASGSPGSGVPGSGVPGSGVPGFSDGSSPSVVVYTTTLLPSGLIPNDPFGNGASTVITVTFPNPTATGPKDSIVQTLTYIFPPATPGAGGGLPSTPTNLPGGLGSPGQVSPVGYNSDLTAGTAIPLPPDGGAGEISDTLYLTSTFVVTQTIPAAYNNGNSVVTYLSVATAGTALPSVASGAGGVFGQPGQLQPPVPGGQSGSGQVQPPASGAGQSGTGQPGTGLPGTGLPGAGQPGTGQPGTGQPGIGQPGTGQPGTGQSQPLVPGTGQPGAAQPQPLVSGSSSPASAPCTSGLQTGIGGLSGTVAPAQPLLPSGEATLPGGYGFTQPPMQPPAGVPTPAQPVNNPLLSISGALPLIGTQSLNPLLPTGVPQPPSGIPPAAGNPAQQVPGAAAEHNSKDCSTTLRTLIVTSVQTSTFFNIVPELTTTYTFPYQALVTVESTIVTAESAPTLLKKFRRQHDEPLVFANTTQGGHPASFAPPVDATLITIQPAVIPTALRRFKRHVDIKPAFANTTTTASRPSAITREPTLSTLFPKPTHGNSTFISTSSLPALSGTTVQQSTASPVRDHTSSSLSSRLSDTPSNILTASATIPVQVPICTGAKEVGNQVLDFDELPVGPLYNPYSRFWFSTGFLIAPPPSVPYTPSSGGRLLEFVPPVLTNGTLDTSQFGAGIDAASNCFRFNFFGANLGCDAHGENQFCEFTFTGYRFNSTLNAEAEVLSQVTWVPSCPTLKECNLTPFLVEGFNNLSSVLVTLRVDGKPRPWWADDLKVGWTDNSCDAARCRAGTPHHTATKRGKEGEPVWYWTPGGLRRLGSRFMKFRG
ncbi:conserved hypothetical protein [Verticillium alfalfae VaMs.102]|uniref:DUF7371 domain-containing protein n=1 Tax=Verticillium alfalfae (strain VaMs.102 / ATCC MYA-4576 / FGSC 10136) TaxID=526221 RepID=C9SRD9_VERA1|nr:conserved hypothetical protein [Verticillium alfalfae VaMs.102]EEY21354.1 conserved hypothetical protein [Verticillium alfalfae VaMs.102]